MLKQPAIWKLNGGTMAATENHHRVDRGLVWIIIIVFQNQAIRFLARDLMKNPIYKGAVPIGGAVF